MEKSKRGNFSGFLFIGMLLVVFVACTVQQPVAPAQVNTPAAEPQPAVQATTTPVITAKSNPITNPHPNGLTDYEIALQEGLIPVATVQTQTQSCGSGGCGSGHGGGGGGSTTPVVNLLYLRPVSGKNYNLTNTVTISTNTSSTLSISYVRVNITLPNSSVTVLQLKHSTGAKYNNTYTIPSVKGTYTIKFLANDTSNNKNSLTTTTFIANDVTKPLVKGVRPVNATNYNLTNTITISANVTDNIAVSYVKVNITYPNNTVSTVQLKFSSGSKYNNTFFIPINLKGVYTVRFIANDTSNNKNSTVITKFVANDVTKPEVKDTMPLNASNQENESILMISANVTDAVGVSYVKVNITQPNTTVTALQLKFYAVNRYNNTFLIPNSDPGLWSIRFIANDTSNNKNQSVVTYFNVTGG